MKQAIGTVVSVGHHEELTYLDSSARCWVVLACSEQNAAGWGRHLYKTVAVQLARADAETLSPDDGHEIAAVRLLEIAQHLLAGNLQSAHAALQALSSLEQPFGREPMAAALRFAATQIERPGQRLDDRDLLNAIAHLAETNAERAEASSGPSHPRSKAMREQVWAITKLASQAGLERTPEGKFEPRR